MDDFVSLGELLLGSRRLSTGTLATAIEQHGICGWDRYDRFRKFVADTEDARRALDALAYQTGHDDRESMAPVDLDEGDSAFSRYGWRETCLPDFAAITSSQEDLPPPRRSKGSSKSDNATTVIVGALLAYITGNTSQPQHPEFKSETQLIEFLESEFDGYAGMSRRNLQDKFAQAKKLIAMR